MLILVRDSFLGRLAYILSGRKILTHKEERPNYVVADEYQSAQKPIKVKWDSDYDPDNPKNWPSFTKFIVSLQIGVLTTAIYMGSSIYVPGVEQIMKEFNVSLVVGYLPLSLFVFGYGIGPMFFSPLSEHPVIGRSPIYITTLFIFVLLQIPIALSNNISGLLVLRFLSGVFASPALATGGATIGDVFNMSRAPLGLTCWAIGATGGPVLGPLIGGVLVEKVNWRWPFWFLLILGGITFMLLSFTFPETSEVTLLYRKAERLRAITGNGNIISSGHEKLESTHPKQLAKETLWRPLEIAFGEPIVFLINLYVALMYAVMYLWFEAFPIVFQQIHGFNMIQTGAGYCSILIGNIISGGLYLIVLNKIFTRPMENGNSKSVTPEVFLPGAIVGAVLQPIGIFIFAWTSTSTAHWVAPLIGAGTFTAGAFVGFQALFTYMAFSFPRYQASVFAGNGLFRACFAGAFPLFAKELYSNLGPKNFPVGWGCSILGFANVVMILVPVLFYINGVKLRARSKYSN